jgi:hypothetical protein
MLRSGWDDDLRAFARSWNPSIIWLSLSEEVHPQRWQRPTYTHLMALCGIRLANLPNGLSRDDIFGVAQGANADPVTAFLWPMAWGHNGNPMGASRTNRFVGRPNASANLAQIIGSAQAGNIQAAFVGLHGPLNVPGLATSFGTKLIYFAGYDSKSDSTQPLILDSFVTSALAEVIDPALARAAWNHQTRSWDEYWSYCELLWTIRNKYLPDSRIDLVEYWLWLHGGGYCWHRSAIRRNASYPLPR